MKPTRRSFTLVWLASYKRGLIDLRRLLPQKSKAATGESAERKTRPFPIEWKLPQSVLDRISPRMTPSAVSKLDD